MPTGYTAAVADGMITSLRDYALSCARGMGALIMMRDAPHDAPIPERFEPSSYHDEQLAEARKRLQDLYDMTNAEADMAAADAHAAAVARCEEANLRDCAIAERYEVMLSQVKAWEGAPEGLKEFMISQLQDSASFDVISERTTPPAQSGEDWRAAEIEKAQRDVRYHTAERAKEIGRTEARNAWLAQLRAALEGVE